MKKSLVTKRAPFLALSLALLLSLPAFAEWHSPMVTETIPGSNFYLSPGEMKTVYVGSGWRYVEKVFVQAYGHNSDATFEVVANGEAKGTIYVPGRDPNYVVTIKETVRSLQFRHVSGGTASVVSVKAVFSEVEFPVEYVDEHQIFERGLHHPWPVIDFPVYSEATGLALRAIRLVDMLEGYANYVEYGEYLLPIKKVAARAYAAAAAKGSLSHDVWEHLVALKRQIAYASDYLDETFERSAAFNLAVELTSLREGLDRVLR